MPDLTAHTVAWFYQLADLERAKAEAMDARARARVYWGSTIALQDSLEAELRVAALEKAT